MRTSAYLRRWHKKHPGKQKEYDDRRYANPDLRKKCLRRSKKYYLSHKKKKLAVHRIWAQKHPEKTREYSRNNMRKLRRFIVFRLGDKCECCGEKIFPFLEIHHRNGGGTKEREKLGMIPMYYKISRMKNPRKKYGLLCANCHRAITSFGFCPHEGISLVQEVPQNDSALSNQPLKETIN